MASSDLYGALAAAILQDTTARWKRPVPEGHGHFTFTAVCEMLVTSASRKPSTPTAAIVMRRCMGNTDWRSTAARRPPSSRSVHRQARSTCRRLTRYWRRGWAAPFFFKLVSVTPEPFGPHDDVQAVMREL